MARDPEEMDSVCTCNVNQIVMNSARLLITPCGPSPTSAHCDCCPIIDENIDRQRVSRGVFDQLGCHEKHCFHFSQIARANANGLRAVAGAVFASDVENCS